MQGKSFAGILGVVLIVVSIAPGGVLEGASFIRGDADASGQLDITDGISVLGYLFLGNPASLDCEEAADADSNGAIELTDAVYLLSYLFLGGPEPKAPFPACGPSPEPGGLGCASYPPCGGQPTATAFDLIDQALAAGDISEETALIYRVFHVHDDERLPAAYRGASSDLKDSPIIDDVIEQFGQLSESGRAILAPFLIPPAAPGSWLDQKQLAGGGSIDWQTVVSPSGKVKVWYQTRHAGDDAQAATIAGAVDGIWDKLVAYMGLEPLPDGEVTDPNGGDAKYDIYLVHLQSILGSTRAYKPAVLCSHLPTYMLIDSRQGDCLLSTVAHELMHAIQWSYTSTTGCTADFVFRWWKEASSTWAEEYVFRKDKNECQDPFAVTFLSHPDEPLEFSGKPYNPHHVHPYGAYLFPYFLEPATGTPDYVRTIWENCTQFNNPLDAIDASLPDGFKRWWPLFAVYNWNDHPQYNYLFDNFIQGAWGADPATGKPGLAGNTITPVELNGQADLHIPMVATLQHLSAIYYHFKFTDDNVSYVSFEHPFDPQANPTVRVQAMIQMVGDRDYSYEDWTETPVKSFCREHAEQRLDNLVIILSNSEWKDRTHPLDPPNPPVLYARNSCLPGSWTGTITSEVSFGDDITYHFVDGTFKIVRSKKTIAQRWEIGPRVLGSKDSGCETFVANEATWTGSTTVDDYTESHERCSPGCTGQICIETSVQQDQIASGPNPSAILFDHRCAEVYWLDRATGADIGAPPLSYSKHPTSYTENRCDGTYTFPLPDLDLREDGIQRLELQVTDPSVAQAFRGQTDDRQETPASGMDEGFSFFYTTWTWDVVREPN